MGKLGWFRHKPQYSHHVKVIPWGHNNNNIKKKKLSVIQLRVHRPQQIDLSLDLLYVLTPSFSHSQVSCPMIMNEKLLYTMVLASLPV